MASRQQNKAFMEEVLPSDILDSAVDFIGRNMEPEDVFTDSLLTSWAESNGFTKENT